MVQGFSQVSEIDFNKIFVPNIRQKSLRIFLVLVILLDLFLIQIDFITAYLENKLGQNE